MIYMIFSNRKKIQMFHLESMVMRFDGKLTWKLHLNDLRTKTAKSFALLYKVRELFNDKAMYMLYKTITVPHDLLY